MPYFTRREILVALKKAILGRVKNPLIRSVLVYRLNKLLLLEAKNKAWVFGNAFSSAEYMDYRFGQTDDFEYLNYKIEGVQYEVSTDLLKLCNDVMSAEYDRGFLLSSFGAAIKQIFAGRPLEDVDCPVDFVDVWFTLTQLLQRFPLDKHNKRWTAFFDRLTQHSTIRYRRFSPVFLGRGEGAHNGVLFTLLKNLDAPKYEPILRVLGMSREFVHTAALIMQRQGYVYGDMDTKRQVSYEILRVLTKMGNRSPSLKWLNGAFDYPSEAALERMSTAELATVNQFYNYDILQLTQNIATFLSVITMGGGSLQSQKPTPVLASKMTGEALTPLGVEPEMEIIMRRVKASIRALGKTPPLEYDFDPALIFNRLFIKDNAGKKYNETVRTIKDRMDTTNRAHMDAMRNYVEDRSHDWIDDDASAELFDQIYTFFTSPPPVQSVDEDVRVRRQLVEYDKLSSDDMRHMPSDQLHTIWRLIDSHSTIDPSPSINRKIKDALDHIYIQQTTNDMMKLSMNELKGRLDFIDEYYPGDNLLRANFTDNFLYALELKHEADPLFEPFSVL